MKTISTVMLTCGLAALASIPASAAESTVDLTGTWICTEHCPAGGVGAEARIIQDGDDLTFINEGGGTSTGFFKDLNTVVASEWNIHGALREDGGEILWSNNTVWTRKSSAETLSGTWVCNAYCPAGGEGAEARIEQDDQSLVFINEGGGRSKGYFKNETTVVASDWIYKGEPLSGTLRKNRTELLWENNTLWTRKQ